MDAFWVFLRHNDCAYVMNKMVSVCIAGGLAWVTATHKPMLQQYTIEYPRMDNVTAYNYIYWLLFIYYCFAGLDELLECYRAFFKVPKSSIGLLFELNYFLGAGIMMYIGWFSYNSMASVPDKFKPIQTFLEFQIQLLFLMGAVTIFMWTCFGCLNKRIERQEADKVKVADSRYQNANLEDDE